MERLSVCLDTSILIDYFRKEIKARSVFYRLAGEYGALAITSVTEFEIRRGLTPAQEPLWQTLMTMMEVLPFDSRASQVAVAIDKELKRRENR